MRTRPGWVEPEIYFRIVHLAQAGHSGAPVAAYPEQMVEIAIGPKGALENGNIGTLNRRVAANQIFNSVPIRRGNSNLPREPKTPRVFELLLKAIEWQALLESSEISSQTEIARREGITRARVIQVMGMLRLVPEIQQRILSIPEMVRRPPVTERMLRPIEPISDVRGEGPGTQQCRSVENPDWKHCQESFIGSVISIESSSILW